mgnify:CR=1 FL=1
MIGNYFKTALRNILKHKSYSLINIIGLSIGIACFVLIGLYIADEMSYDRYHEKSDRIYRVVNVYDFDGVGENSASAPFPVAFTLKNEYPGLIKNVVRIFDFQVSRSLVEYKDKSFNERNLFFADSTFFNIFDYEFVKGDPETALQEANSVVITETAARKYFGDEEPMGRVLRYDDRVNLKVTGLIRDVPLQSHFQFSLVASMSTIRQITRGQLPRTWVWNPCWTYVLLKEGVAPEEIDKDLPNYVNKFFYDAEKENISLYLQPLEDIHLKSKLDYEIEPNNDIGNLYILAVIAFFLLVIAAINFMNLATATSTGRSKEIGIKKVVGAYRKQIIRQFLGESIMMSFFAMIVALFLIELALPAFNDFTGKEISLSRLFHPVYMGALLLITLLTGFLSGVYPAFYLSSFKPVQVLKGKVSKGAKSGKSRKVLVVMQFAISIALIISTFIAYDQISYIRNADLGFKKDDIIIVPINRTNIAEGFKEFKNELQNNPDIYSVTAMDDILGKAHNTHEFRPEGYPEDKWNFYPALVVHYDFLKTFDIKVIAGRDYSELHKTDPMKGLLINEAMVRHLGWGSPEKALGKKLITIRGDERVIGVTENFNVTSLHQPAGPFALNMKEEEWSIHWFTNFMAVRHIPGKEKEVLAYLEKKWKEREGERPFEYSFLEDELSQLYEGEEKLGSLSLIFAVLIIFIAALGLFGLASFMAEQRTKEIGIRKVLGAQTLSIIRLMSFDFMKLVLIATLISWPLSYIFMDNWLENFAYRTQINLPAFVLAALIALTIAMSITSVKAYFASQTDPVDTLKYE